MVTLLTSCKQNHQHAKGGEPHSRSCRGMGRGVKLYTYQYVPASHRPPDVPYSTPCAASVSRRKRSSCWRRAKGTCLKKNPGYNKLSQFDSVPAGKTGECEGGPKHRHTCFSCAPTVCRLRVGIQHL